MDSGFGGIGERLENLMKIKKMKQVDISKKTGLSKNTVCNYINGNRIPDTEALYKLSKLFGVSMEWLLTGNSSNTQDNDRTILQDESINLYLKELSSENLKEVASFIQFKLFQQKSNTFYCG